MTPTSKPTNKKLFTTNSIDEKNSADVEKVGSSKYYGDAGVSPDLINTFPHSTFSAYTTYLFIHSRVVCKYLGMGSVIGCG